MDADLKKKLGPLAALAGVWEGNKGADAAPDDDRTGTEINEYRERMTFEPFGPTNNHEQELWGMRYTTTAWRIGEDNAFHEEMGYWQWDAVNKQVMRCFLVPRGIALIAGGSVEPDAKEFELIAKLGSPTYGICSNIFLDREFKTVRYEMKIAVRGDELEYQSNTQIQMPGRKEIFNHTDKNVLKRVSFTV